LATALPARRILSPFRWLLDGGRTRISVAAIRGLTRAQRAVPAPTHPPLLGRQTGEWTSSTMCRRTQPADESRASPSCTSLTIPYYCARWQLQIPADIPVSIATSDASGLCALTVALRDGECADAALVHDARPTHVRTYRVLSSRTGSWSIGA